MVDKRITVIALAVFSIVMLLANGNIERVYAVIIIDRTYNDVLAPNFHTITGIGSVYTVYNEADDEIRTYKGSDATVLYTNDVTTIAESAGGDAGTAIIRAIDCNSTTCYVLVSVNISAVARCRIIDVTVSTGAMFIGYTTTTGPCHNALTLGVYIVEDNAGAERLMELNTSTNPYTATQLSADLGTGSVYCLKQITLSTVNYLGICSDSANNWFKLFKLNTSTICTVPASTFTAQDVDSDGTFAYVGISTGDIKKITSACAISSTITSICGTVQSVDISGSKMYVGCETDSAVSIYDFTLAQEVAQYGCGGTITVAQYPKTMDYSSSLDAIVCATYTGDNVRTIYLTGTSGAGTLCIDTTGDTEVDVCFTDTDGNGVPDAGAGGALSAYRGTANVTQFGADLGCAFGFTSCTNKDIKTNGVGLLYLLIIIVWSYALLVFIHFEAKKLAGSGNVHLTEVLNINPILLIVMLFVDVGLTWRLGWIQDEIFYTALIGVIGIASFGLYRHFRGD